MNTKFSLDKHDSLVKHQKQMQNLDKQHKLELEKVKLIQEKQIQELKNDHSVKVSNLQTEQERDVIKKIYRNEETLDRLSKNLDEVKQMTEKERANLITEHNRIVEENKILHQQKLANEKEKYSLRVQELNDKGNSELQKINRQTKLAQHEVDYNANKDLKLSKDIHETKMNLTKDMFLKKQAQSDDKYHRTLHKQKTDQNKVLTQEVRKHQKALRSKNEQFTAEINKIQEDGNKKKLQTMKNFEKDFQATNKKNEEVLKTIIGKKEQLLEKVKDSITEQYKIGIEKQKDDFYHFGKLEVNVSELPNQDGYKVEVPVAEHEKNHVQMRAEKRELRLSMERRYENTIEEDNMKNSINKVESVVSKIPVKNIIDPKTITKNYADGILTFEIKNA